MLIIGAGLSGIGAAAQLMERRPGTTYAILESREVSGGTWDLFRYPGVRSDSDMYTLGYRFKPWLGEKALADGPAILDYVRETADERGIAQRIRYRHRVVAASWDSDTARWTVTAETPAGAVELTCGFLWSCSGYYDYDRPHSPEFAGRADFTGQVVHPQHWPEDLDVTDQHVVVIGSGATAITLAPALARQGAARVTMLQRSPTYVMSMPAVDWLGQRLRRWLPSALAYRLIRWKNIATATATYELSQRRPGLVRRFIRKMTLKMLPEGYDVDTHFNPRYDPWDQRLCLVPDADLFKEISDGRVDVVTDTVRRFTPTGVHLSSGRELPAAVVVTATGLNIKAFGGLQISVDGHRIDLTQTLAYRALMLSQIPNFAFVIGYTNASWTLKADLVSEFVCRLLEVMDQRGHRSVMPVPGAQVGSEPFLDFTAGYVLRAVDQLPRQGDREPWRLRQNYFHDVRAIRRADMDDGTLVFG